MDTKQNTLQVPDLQLAKVGDRRRRKGAGATWFGASSAASRSGAGGIWGSLSGIFGTSALKIGVALLVGTMGVGAYSVGKGMRPDESKYVRKSQLFADKNAKPNYGDVSNLPGGRTPSQNSVSMVSGSLDGLTPEERAAKEAKAAADAKAAAEAQAKADADAKAKEAASVPGAAVPGDPRDLAAAQAAAAAKEKEKAAAFSQRFGELSKGGSGLSGGGGLSGGIGQGFAPLAKNPGSLGNLAAMGANRAGQSASASQIRASGNPGRGLAQSQLNRAAMMTGATKSGVNETAATAAGVPFDTGAGASQLLSGTGGGQSGGGPTTGAADQNPSSGGGGGSSPVGIGGGGDTGGGDDDCGSLAAKYGWQGNFVNSSDGGCVLNQPNVAGSGSSDPSNMLFNMLEVLAALGILIGLWLAILAKMEKTPATFAACQALEKTLAGFLIGIGAIETILGLAVVGMGKTLEGSIFTIMGAGTTICGIMSYATADLTEAKLTADKISTVALVSTLSAAAQAGELIGAACH
jgi:hypothetical protein